MNVVRTVRLAAATCVLTLAGVSLASAEIVVMTSGRTVSVKSHKIDGDSIILTLRSGGQVTCDRSLVDKVLPDEVPHPEPEPAQAAVSEAPLPSASRGAQLRDSVYAELIASAAQAHGVDPVLVQALIQVESNYRPRARSNRGAMGLMQLMPATVREYNVRNAYDPKANVDAGVRKLKSLIDKYKVFDLALAAYNAGEGAVERFKGIPPYRETQNYVSRILSMAGLR
ncbi:MAG TPA: lytic transglycosylase domain-containing protein [Vicinamibacterales bacterium]|nr:lytic transglycosylase domain-containing protein [Vicinamibacterales bacterium]